MDWVMWGSLATGIFVGYLSWFFITRFQEYTLQALIGVIGVLFAGTVVTFLVNNMKVDANGFGQYAVGLLIGLVVYAVLRRVNTGAWPTLSS